MIIGILALQGGYQLHEHALTELGIKSRRVVDTADINGIHGLIIPGGESSTMIKLASSELWEKLREFSTQKPVWGICAGAIIIASKVENPSQKCLGSIAIDVSRNYYGAQNDSFIVQLEVLLHEKVLIEGIFIRAPRIKHIGETVKVLSQYQGDPVIVEQGHCLATTFHPELTPNLELHHYFLSKITNRLQ